MATPDRTPFSMGYAEWPANFILAIHTAFERPHLVRVTRDDAQPHDASNECHECRGRSFSGPVYRTAFQWVWHPDCLITEIQRRCNSSEWRLAELTWASPRRTRG